VDNDSSLLAEAVPFGKSDVVLADGVTVFASPLLRGVRGGGTNTTGVKDNPVNCSQTHRTVSDLQIMVLVTFAGRECHDRIKVPITNTTLLPVMMWNGQVDRNSHTGVTTKMRRASAVRAGAVVAVVGVVPVERK
jgi:hypothetical protein